MPEDFKAVDFSKYAELRDLWNMHPSNTEGALYKGYQPAEGESAEVMRRYGELSQQLADEVGGGDLATEAMIALGAVGGIGNGLTGENLGDPNYYKNMMGRRQEYLDSGRSVQDADSIDAYRFASVLTGQRPADLSYVQNESLRNQAMQYGTPNEINYYNQAAAQQRISQPQPMQQQITQPQPTMSSFNFTQPVLNTPNYLQSYSPLKASQPIQSNTQYFQPHVQNTQMQNVPFQTNLQQPNILSGQYNQNVQQGMQPQRMLSQLNLPTLQNKRSFNL